MGYGIRTRPFLCLLRLPEERTGSHREEVCRKNPEDEKKSRLFLPSTKKGAQLWNREETAPDELVGKDSSRILCAVCIALCDPALLRLLYDAMGDGLCLFPAGRNPEGNDVALLNVFCLRVDKGNGAGPDGRLHGSAHHDKWLDAK